MLRLPTEIILSILQHLPLPSIAAFARVHKSWADFIATNESNVFRNAAALHGFIPAPDVLLGDVARVCSYSARAMEGVRSWRDLCRRRLDIARNWRGQPEGEGTGASVTLSRSIPHVHRIKVDECEGIVITTSPRWGLFVTDLETDELLWCLPQNYVRPYAHCEYSNGFLVFDRHDGSKEVWRLHSHSHSLPSPSTPSSSPSPTTPSTPPHAPHAPPSPSQLLISTNQSKGIYGPLPSLPNNTSTPPLPPLSEISKGRFDPWAHLVMPEPTTAYRVVGGTLLVGAYERVYLWDLRTGEGRGVVEGIQDVKTDNDNDNANDTSFPAAGGSEGLGDLNYVELNAQHAFICGMHSLRIFDLSLLHYRRVLEIPSTTRRVDGRYGRWSARVTKGGGVGAAWGRERGRMKEVARCVVAVSRNGDADEVGERRRIVDEFVAAHVSPCGTHLAALLSSSRLLIISNFPSVISGHTALFDATIEVTLGSARVPSVYLAYEGDTVGVVTQLGIFLVSFTPPTPTPHGPPEPELTIRRLPRFYLPQNLASISCLQMTDTGLFVNWPPSPSSSSSSSFSPSPSHSYFPPNRLEMVQFERSFNEACEEETEPVYDDVDGDLFVVPHGLDMTMFPMSVTTVAKVRFV